MVRIGFLRIMELMLAQQFVYWCETASAAERCAAVAMLADAVVNRKFLPSDLREAEAALMVAAEDPSPRVRRAIADGVASAGNAPRQLVRLLSRDIDDVAVPVIVLSPLLTVEDLCDLVRAGRPAVSLAVAKRLQLPATVAAEIVAGGDAVACLELARNQTAELEGAALCHLVEEAAQASDLRFALLQRGDLPAGLRHALLSCLGDALCRSALVANIVGPTRAERLRQDVHEQATASLIDSVKADELSAFVEQLRGTSQLNAAVLVRAVCMGRIDLFAASMARLTGLSDERVRSVIADAREPAFMALASAAGLPKTVVPLLLSAVRVWKDMAGDDRFDHADVASSVMERVVIAFRKDADGAEADELSRLLHRMSCEMQQASARRRTDRYLAA
ncbi:DUF2336 domain-containing protein [Aureimonas sp. SK2]|uniref:DUF2336 domain-containing protein n=1 Tax=Aureimonas sp. SK2 TaxID=3015992 RepID=UPI0024450F78|nr:DUF2336 domain-containing protein [Aureimonas sp. SK2]